jgi:hypothetical protein
MTDLSLFKFVVTVVSASLATFLGAFAVEYLKSRSQTNRARSDYKAQLAIEFEQLIKLISRLKEDYKSRRYFPINLLELAAGVVLKIEERLKQLTLLSDSDLQRKAFEVIADCHLLIIEINGVEQWPLKDGIDTAEKEKRLKAAKEEERPEKNVELSDMLKRLGDIVEGLR